MSEEPSAPPFFRPAAPKKATSGGGEIADARVDHRDPTKESDHGGSNPPPLTTHRRKGRPPIQNVTWTDAFRVYKLLLSFPREMQQAIIDAVQEEQ